MKRLRNILSHVLLSIALLWPICHIWMVRHWETSVWKFVGMAMYVVPNMRWEGWILDNSAPAAPPFELTPDGNTSFGSWLGYVHIWGQAVDVRAFAESFFESNPSIRGLRIKIEERHLRPGCNLIGSRVLYWDIVRNDDDQITIWPSRDDTWVDFIPAESVLLSD